MNDDKTRTHYHKKGIRKMADCVVLSEKAALGASVVPPLLLTYLELVHVYHSHEMAFSHYAAIVVDVGHVGNIVFVFISLPCYM